MATITNARSHHRRSSDDDFDDVTSSRRHHTTTHHHRHHQQLRHQLGNVTKHDLHHSPQVRLQVARYNSERCRRGEFGDDETDVTWSRDGSCEVCSCWMNSQVFCQTPTCPQPHCDENLVHVEGECCPMCPEKLCRADDGRYFKDGAEWHLDDCTSCECNKGKILCSVEDCQYKSCSNAIKVPGKCCPVCPDSSCLSASGENHTSDAVWQEGLCTNCYCKDGEGICADVKCPHIKCNNPYRHPDACCYKCADAVECVMAPWGAWGECPVQECGGGVRRRYRETIRPARNGGAFCPHYSEAQLCPALPCEDVPVCPVSEWSAWSHCTATCGGGQRLRSRTLTKVNRAIMLSVINCSTTHLQESTRCYSGTCQLSAVINNMVVDMGNEAAAVHCPQTVWGEWGPCSTSCGVGVKSREQMTSWPGGNMTSSNRTCHLLTETKKCHGRDCKKGRINCKVTTWGSWTPCDATCGAGAMRSRQRMVTRPARNGGHPCPTDLIITRPCRLPDCNHHHHHELTPQDGGGEEVCVSDEGKHRSEGEIWSPVECLTCTCTNQRKVCNLITCPPPHCTHPHKIPGFCCPFCTN